MEKTLTIIMFIVLGTTCALADSSSVILYDVSHRAKKATPRKLPKLAENLDAVIRVSDRTITCDVLRGVDLLYLQTPVKPFVSEEVDCIKDYLNAGGSLLLIMDEERRTSLSETRVNFIIEPFGFHFGEDTEYLHNCGGIAKVGVIHSAAHEIPYSGGRTIEGGTPFAFRLDQDGNPAEPSASLKELDHGGRIVVMSEAMVALLVFKGDGERLSGVPNNPKKTTYWGTDSVIFMTEVLDWCLKKTPGRDADKSTPSSEYLTQVWQVSDGLKTPEAAVYDAKRDVIYVSNFNVRGGFLRRNDNSPDEFISRVSPSGEMLELKWVKGLNAPTGMAIHDGRLFVVERGHVVIIDIEAESIIKRLPLPDARFPNDIVVTSDGTIYVTDNSRKAKTSLYKISGEQVEPWISASEINRCNGLCLDGEELIAFDMNSEALKAIRLDNKQIRTIASLKQENETFSGAADGIIPLDEQTYLITFWSGPGFLVTKTGSATKIMDTQKFASQHGQRVNNADVGYIPHQRLILIPTFSDHSLIACKLEH